MIRAAPPPTIVPVGAVGVMGIGVYRHRAEPSEQQQQHRRPSPPRWGCTSRAVDPQLEKEEEEEEEEGKEEEEEWKGAWFIQPCVLFNP